MAGIVTYKKLFSESRNNVVDLIKNNISDPISFANQSRKFIYAREPDVKANDFKGYPYIIVNSSNVDTPIEKQSGDGKHKEVIFDIEVDIVSSDRGYGSNDGKGSEYLDNFSDQIMYIFNDVSNRNRLINNRMSMSYPVSNDVEVIPIADELVYRRSISLTFKNRMAVSA